MNTGSAGTYNDDFDVMERLKYACIDDEVCTDIRNLWPLVQPAIGSYVEEFFAQVSRKPEIHLIVKENADRLHADQIKHWAHLFAAHFDDDYVQSVKNVGNYYYRIGLESHFYTYGNQFILNKITARLIRKKKLSPWRLARQVTALNRAVSLDMGIALSNYHFAVHERLCLHHQQVDEAIELFKVAVGEIVTQTEEHIGLAQTATSTLDRISEHASHESLSAAAASDEISSTVQSIASATEELSVSINDICQHISETTRSLQQANALVDTSANSVQNLDQAGQEIGSVIKFIQGIAEQTNLLALNATIEAARAGEAGRGFSVVAQEVKALANQTTKASEEIAQRIGGIQTETQKSVSQIREIADIMVAVEERAQSIASSMEEQGAATREISFNVQGASAGTSDLAVIVSNVESTICTVRTSAEAADKASTSLAEQSGRLTDEIRKFLKSLREGPFDRRDPLNQQYYARERRSDRQKLVRERAC